ncbi:hypothetical protein M3215_06395 [Bacillus cytotoxicus]|uniref:Uncharacterized protein n=1 Tax=Bacillus cytotoxicus TaxID=580165 RepID=A0ACC6A4R1_9BACI|nr:hypothetical protein [Bacillus cytotoxicus]
MAGYFLFGMAATCGLESKVGFIYTSKGDEDVDSTEKVLASCCYFSIFVSPLLFPIIVYFVVPHEEVKFHAKKAFISHLLPFFCLFFVFLLGFMMNTPEQIGVMVLIAILLFGLVNLVIFIWNIVKGVQLLVKE